MFKSFGNSLILRGVLALTVGGIAIAWPGVTVLALVVMFAVFAYMAASLEAALAFGSSTTKPVVAHLLLALLDVAAGVTAIAWPGVTALVLVVLVASWAIATGSVEIYAAVRSRAAAGTRAMFILGGLVSAAFGVVLLARPDMGALTLALLFGLFNLVSGTSLVIQGIEARSTDAVLRDVITAPKTHATV